MITCLIASAVVVGGCTPTAPSEAAPTPPAPTDNNETSAPLPEDDTPSPDADTTETSDDTPVGSDPVSGQSQEVDLRWEDFCMSSQYQVQIAKDPGFTMIVLDTGAFAPASSDAPAAYYPAGGLASSPSSLTRWAGLQSGQTYYWRVRARQAATGTVMRSPWSEVKAFTVGSGFPVSNPSYGIQSLSPNNGRSNCPVKPVSFTWSPLKDTTKYRFVLAEDAAMTRLIKETEVTTTAYEYDGQLEYNQSYFWRVMALEPVPSDWSAIFSFQTQSAPPAPPAQPEAQSETPPWAWVVIASGLALLIGITVLLFRTRRV